MKKSKRHVIGTITFNPKDITRNRGHEYGAGRSTSTHTPRAEKRAKQKLKKELDW
jgi:hypothetical protein